MRRFWDWFMRLAWIELFILAAIAALVVFIVVIVARNTSIEEAEVAARKHAERYGSVHAIACYKRGWLSTPNCAVAVKPWVFLLECDRDDCDVLRNGHEGLDNLEEGPD